MLQIYAEQIYCFFAYGSPPIMSEQARLLEIIRHPEPVKDAPLRFSKRLTYYPTDTVETNFLKELA